MREFCRLEIVHFFSSSDTERNFSNSLYIMNSPRKMNSFYIPFQNVVHIFLSGIKDIFLTRLPWPSFLLKKWKKKLYNLNILIGFLSVPLSDSKYKKRMTNWKPWKVKSNPKRFTHLCEPLWRILKINSAVIHTASPTALWQLQTQTIFSIFIPKCPLSSR